MTVRELNTSNFGIVIAWLIPGFITLCGLSLLSPELARWLNGSASGALTVGGFLYVTLASLTLGLIVSTIRWATVDVIHHRSGLARPSLKFSRLQSRTTAFLMLVEHRYRFYQFYANSAVAVLVATTCWLLAGRSLGVPLLSTVIEAILLAGSRDSLRGYYEEAAQLLGRAKQRNTH